MRTLAPTRNLAKLTAAGVALVLLSGCGGDGSNPNIANIYTGTWTGTYVAAESQGAGTITLVVSSSGALSGTVSGTGGLTGSFVGTMLGTGQFSATKVTSAAGYFTAIQGAIALTNSGIAGNFQYEWVQQHYVGTLTAANNATTTPTSG
jgi:hydroxyethylthiazole kinase-like sugar kinase family protein